MLEKYDDILDWIPQRNLDAASCKPFFLKKGTYLIQYAMVSTIYAMVDNFTIS
jgi:hypothetical protein